MKFSKSGVYQIINVITKESYIGSTVSFKDRFNLHKSHLKRNIHSCKRLQESFNKNEELIFNILECIENTGKLLEREQYYLDTTANLYNECKFAGNTKGRESVLKKTILQYSLEGNFIKEWESAEQIKKEFKLSASSKISNVCDGIRNKAYGFIWKRKEDDKEIITNFVRKGKGIAEVDENNNIIKNWNRIIDCSKETKISSPILCKILNSNDKIKTYNNRRFIRN